ncbi:MAG: VWA domain-containing protein, partial [Planctomycetota bacterium]|nr:VWA domain-containing protein [Planctomycetota bacterium]
SRAREAIEPLIEALAKTKGRLQNEIANALESLTGESFGRTPATWRKWWFERGVSFKVPEVAPTFWPEQGETQYAFYGIRLVSDRAAFVCDVSGSMKGTSIQTLQRELAAVVKRFPPQGKFNFIFFNDKVHPWAKKLVSANAKEKKKALAMIEKMGASGATNLWDALKRAMNDKDVDTIVLLSDGAPTAGKIQNSKKIAQTFFKLNRDRMVLLHVVAIGQVAPYLESMAKLSGGSYVER